MSKTFTCDSCGGVFPFVEDWDAEAEARELWGDLPESERSIICDDCFNGFMPWMRENHPEAIRSE